MFNFFFWILKMTAFAKIQKRSLNCFSYSFSLLGKFFDQLKFIGVPSKIFFGLFNWNFLDSKVVPSFEDFFHSLLDFWKIIFGNFYIAHIKILVKTIFNRGANCVFGFWP